VPRSLTLDDIRRFAVRRTLFAPTTIARAVERLAFVQADPIRAPARAQDLTLRHRVRGYRAGDLERRYQALPVEEDVFINYGFMPRTTRALMHPRVSPSRHGRSRRVGGLLDFVREAGAAHPGDVDAHFNHGSVINYWGGTSNATTHLLERLHYDGLLRVTRRDAGVRVYAIAPPVRPPSTTAARRDRIDALVDLVVRAYAPVTAQGLGVLVRRLRYAVPQWQRELTAALERSHRRLARAPVDGTTWFWPEGERVSGADGPETVRLLAPFDPIVWDRPRFERLWGWAYRFEAYTPLAKRQFGYYALPLLWRDLVIGWGTVAVRDGTMHATLDYVGTARPAEPAFARELDLELDRLRTFLGC
jgi:uncharacterized protein YcaQ